MSRKSNSKRGSRQRGYTLMEMMVVLALIALAAALVMPSLSRGYGSLELRVASGALSTAMKQARTHALYESRNYFLVFGEEEPRGRDVYVVREDGKSIDHELLQGEIKLRVEQRGEWSSEIRPVHFFADGHAESTNFDLENSRARHIQMTLDALTGRPRISQIYEGETSPPGEVMVFSGGGK